MSAVLGSSFRVLQNIYAYEAQQCCIQLNDIVWSEEPKEQNSDHPLLALSPFFCIVPISSQFDELRKLMNGKGAICVDQVEAIPK